MKKFMCTPKRIFWSKLVFNAIREPRLRYRWTLYTGKQRIWLNVKEGALCMTSVKSDKYHPNVDYTSVLSVSVKHIANPKWNGSYRHDCVIFVNSHVYIVYPAHTQDTSKRFCVVFEVNPTVLCPSAMCIVCFNMILNLFNLTKFSQLITLHTVVAFC